VTCSDCAETLAALTAERDQLREALREVFRGGWVACDMHDTWAAPVRALSSSEPGCQCRPCIVGRAALAPDTAKEGT